MPTESKKKKAKKDEKKPLILIKTEPEELKPLEHYADDRVVLIKQIFSSLKSKTIESIIPEFLQEKPIEEIQEICLEEVLGISKKRLVSIINATKCPSDTESSDSGSDIEKVQEHISLEEISSDSNDELSKPKKKKKRELKKDSHPKPENKKAEQNGQTGEKQYSVLELLELQARARAIRSQLALEPVTKIELDDSDNDESANKEKEETPRDQPAPSVSQNNRKKIEEVLTKHLEDEPKVPTTRPVRLKRNFRQRQMEGYESDEDRSTTEKEQEITNNVSDQTPEQPIEKEKSPEKTVKLIAPTDDDVVPIIAEPEILCISSSESEDDEKKNKAEKNKTKKSYITMPIIEKEVRPPTEDEIFLQKIKEKSEAKKKADGILTKELRSVETSNDEESQHRESEKQKETEDEEMEDGEIIEEDEVLEIPESPQPSAPEQKDDESKNENIADEENAGESRNTSTHEKSKSDNSESSEPESVNDESSRDDSSGNESDNSEPKAKSQTSKKSNADDDDDDIIDLGKDEDLDFEQLEMNTSHEEPKEEPVTTRHTRSKAKKKSDRESSNEAVAKDESWNKRWLRGDKVSKVLATAKLANKVRSNIKEKKTKASEAHKVEVVEPPKVEAPSIQPDVEVGSVEHYKELTKQK